MMTRRTGLLLIAVGMISSAVALSGCSRRVTLYYDYPNGDGTYSDVRVVRSIKSDAKGVREKEKINIYYDGETLDQDSAKYKVILSDIYSPGWDGSLTEPFLNPINSPGNGIRPRSIDE